MTDLSANLGTNQIYWIVLLIAIDAVLGVAAALVKKNFRLGKLANFMKKGVVGYVFGFAVLAVVAQAMPALSLVASVAYILILLALTGSILSNLGKLGLALPDYLKKD